MFGIENLSILHFIVAYTGLVIHILMKLAEIPGPLLSGFTRRDMFVTIASIIAIPVLLIICTDTALKEILPINYVTSFLVGYQTQSLIRSVTMIAGKNVDQNESTN